jgi:uncharacterized protein
VSIVRFGAYLKNRFGERVQRISLHAGMTCPNRDGTLGINGCIFCNNDSFHPGLSEGISISEQMTSGMAKARKRYGAEKFLAYFQTYTNTYADCNSLRSLYGEALSFDAVVGLMISTRPDCINPSTVTLLDEFSAQTMVWVELGVQTMHNHTLKLLNRGHSRQHTEQAILHLKKTPVQIASHIILGLPGETGRHMMQTADWLRDQNIDAVKLHHLHAVRGTRLEKMFYSGEWKPLDAQEYISYAAGFLRRQKHGIIVMRLVADCPDTFLVAPRWSLSKPAIENAIMKRLSDPDMLMKQGES